jgi:hypothetical protein
MKRREFIRSLIPNTTHLFPKEWAYIYDSEIPTTPVKEALQESGVVFINKTIHSESLKYIYQLNVNHPITYKYVWGDKETFWLGCVMANMDYYFNDTAGTMVDGSLTHFYKLEPFWKQK